MGARTQISATFESLFTGRNRTWILLAAGAASVALLAGFNLSFNLYLAMVAGLFLIAAATLGFVVQLEKPFLGFALLLVVAVTFPVEFRGPADGIVSSPFPLAAAICGVWLVHVTLGGVSAALERSRAVYAAIAFIFAAMFSFVMGQFPWFPSAAPLPAQIAQLGLFLLSGCLFLAVGHQLKSFVHLRMLTWLFIGAGVIACIMQMVPALLFIARWTTRPGSVGSLFWTWLAALSLAQALFNRELRLSIRAGMLGVTALVLYHGLFEVRSWASGWVPCLAALSVILLFKFPRLTICMGLVTLPIVLFFAGNVSDTLVSGEEYSLMTRQAASAVLWQLVEKSPVFGMGPANYYYYTENMPLLGWRVRFISHNNYQDLLVQTGFLGFLAFFWFAFELFWMMARLHRRAPQGFAKAYVVGAMGGLIGSLISGLLGDWIIPFYYNAGILGFRSSLLLWVFLGGILALKRMIDDSDEAEMRSYAQSSLN